MRNTFNYVPVQLDYGTYICTVHAVVDVDYAMNIHVPQVVGDTKYSLNYCYPLHACAGSFLPHLLTVSQIIAVSCSDIVLRQPSTQLCYVN